ncbi:MAG TPA: hypothetical protein VGQ11_06895 [Candidatus Acidoferrales bacterium]|nr:hypothetical protein [Candidatus Acidoferrales bacterium]
MTRKIVILAIVAALATWRVAPQQRDPTMLPAHEAHDGLLIAADPFDDAARSKERFGKKSPHSAGILALEIYFKNETDKAVRVDLNSIRLVIESPGQERQQIHSMTVEEVANAIVYPQGLNPTAPRKPLPRPFPGGRTGNKDKDVKQVEDVLRPLALEMDIVPPRATVRGLIFFDLNGHFEKLRDSQLYVPDLAFMRDGKALMFFEVDLSKAARR